MTTPLQIGVTSQQSLTKSYLLNQSKIDTLPHNWYIVSQAMPGFNFWFMVGTRNDKYLLSHHTLLFATGPGTET